MKKAATITMIFLMTWCYYECIATPAIMELMVRYEILVLQIIGFLFLGYFLRQLKTIEND